MRKTKNIRERGKYMKVVQDLRILFFEMYSERFDPAPPPSRENSDPYINPRERRNRLDYLHR